MSAKFKLSRAATDVALDLRDLIEEMKNSDDLLVNTREYRAAMRALLTAGAALDDADALLADLETTGGDKT